MTTPNNDAECVDYQSLEVDYAPRVSAMHYLFNPLPDARTVTKTHCNLLNRHLLKNRPTTGPGSETEMQSLLFGKQREGQGGMTNDLPDVRPTQSGLLSGVDRMNYSHTMRDTPSVTQSDSKLVRSEFDVPNDRPAGITTNLPPSRPGGLQSIPPQVRPAGISSGRGGIPARATPVSPTQTGVGQPNRVVDGIGKYALMRQNRQKTDVSAPVTREMPDGRVRPATPGVVGSTGGVSQPSRVRGAIDRFMAKRRASQKSEMPAGVQPLAMPSATPVGPMEPPGGIQPGRVRGALGRFMAKRRRGQAGVDSVSLGPLATAGRDSEPDMEPVTEPLFKDGVPDAPQPEYGQPVGGLDRIPELTDPELTDYDSTAGLQDEHAKAEEPAFEMPDLPPQEILEETSQESFQMADLPMQSDAETTEAEEAAQEILEETSQESFQMADLPMQSDAETTEAEEAAFEMPDLPPQGTLEETSQDSFPMADLPMQSDAEQTEAEKPAFPIGIGDLPVQTEEPDEPEGEKPDESKPDMLYTPFPDFPQIDEEQKRELRENSNGLVADLPQQTEDTTVNRANEQDGILDVPSPVIDSTLSNPLDDPAKFEEEQKAKEAEEAAQEARDKEEEEEARKSAAAEEGDESEPTSPAEIGIMGPTKPDAVGETMVKEKKGGFDLGMFDIKQNKDKPDGELNIKDKAEGELPPELEMAMKSSVGNVMVAGMKGDGKQVSQASAMGITAKGGKNPLVKLKSDEDEGFLKPSGKKRRKGGKRRNKDDEEEPTEINLVIKRV